jgi:hypothetical protein
MSFVWSPYPRPNLYGPRDDGPGSRMPLEVRNGLLAHLLLQQSSKLVDRTNKSCQFRREIKLNKMLFDLLKI